MTEERKKELGLQVKRICEELQQIAEEWRQELGIPYVCVDVSGISHVFPSGVQLYSCGNLHEEQEDGSRRMISVKGYLNEPDNDIEDMFVYDLSRNDIIKKEDEEDEGNEEDTEE